VDISTGAAQDENADASKDPAAIERGRLGGLKGGIARKKALSDSKRRAIAKAAARARWGKR
jgi:hypothetical protein